MQAIQKFQPQGLWLVISAASIWGTIGVVIQAIYNTDTTTSLFINLARLLIATPVLLAIGWRVMGSAMFRIQRRDALVMVIQGVLLALSHAAYFSGIRYAGVSVTTLLTVCLSPLIVSVLSVLFRLDVFTKRMGVAMVLALVGAGLLVGWHTPSDSQTNLGLGMLFSVMAALSYGGSLLCGRFLANDYPSIQVTAISFSAGTVLLLILNVLNGMVTVHTAQGWLLVAYLGLVPTAFAYWLFQVGLRSVSATSASIITLLEPFVATILAWMLFGETLAVTGIIGAALLLFSIFLLMNTPEKG
jgi:drug/metabolite transporter, DME family